MDEQSHIHRKPRPPVVAIVGHIDHGKSTLLDYIRKTNITAAEAGGITQHLSAYEAVHKTPQGEKKITFLDTPGHEAFAAMRSRGVLAADVAVLVVSAEDGVKPQTLEATKSIAQAGIPYIVAITKIDKPGISIDRAKASLTEHGIYLEGMGGDIPFVGVSGKTGAGVEELLDLIVLSAEMKGLSANPDSPGEGVVIEAHVDQKRGASATLIVQNGTIQSGEYVVAGDAVAPVRIMENFLGKSIERAVPGQPVGIVGFSSVPAVGGSFITTKNKKEAEERARLNVEHSKPAVSNAHPTKKIEAPAEEGTATKEEEAELLILPLVIKTDTAGVGEAVIHELERIPTMEKLQVRVVSRGVGSISEADVKLASGGETPGIVVGFNVKVDAQAQAVAERRGATIATFSLIYELGAWLAEELEKRRPRVRNEEKTGVAKILKLFGGSKQKLVVGGRIEEGMLKLGEEVKILRRDLELGHGSIESLQSHKVDVKKVESGNEFGAIVKTSVDIAVGDRIEAFEVVFK